MTQLDVLSLVRTAGGLGLFLLGMSVMTDALRLLAGRSLRDVLMRFTRSPLSGALTGATSTALLQSSSATTVAAVGFVGAGLMTFRSALGVVFGANLGTTVTGWLVMVVGFRFDLVVFMLLCIFVGMLLKLLTTGTPASIGLAITGFGVIFVGIDQMQIGMSGLHDILAGLDLPADTYLNRIQLVLIGVVFTALTQSSSAGVATVLTAMYSGAVGLGQALALVIGMDVGTTVTALIATIGGSAATRRTGASHFIYNVMTAVMAFLLVTPYVGLWERVAPETVAGDMQLLLVAFHTGFNLLGVILVLPVAGRFADLMQRLIPETDGGYTNRLDRSFLKEPAVAIDALSSSIAGELESLLGHAAALLMGRPASNGRDLAMLQQALDETLAYADRIDLDSSHDGWRPLVNSFHVLDHLQRLHERCDEDAARAAQARVAPHLAESRQGLLETLERVRRCLGEERWEEAAERAGENARAVSGRVAPSRAAIITDAARGTLDVDEATASLEAMRWLSRVSHHVAQITDHLRQIHDGDPAADEAEA